MNEQYLRGYFESYVLPNKPDAVFEDWVSKISTNEQYKQGMFNTYVKAAKPDAVYADWNTKIFGGTQPSANQDLSIEAQDAIRRATLGAVNPMLSVPGVADAALSLGQGGVAAYEGIKGLTGLVSGGHVPQLIDQAESAIFGGTSADLNQNLDQLKSQALQQSEQNVDNAEGFTGTVGAYLDNPAAALSGTLETLPLMIGGGGIARIGLAGAIKVGGKFGAAAATKLGQAVAAGFGEGVITAGSSAEGIRTQTEDQLLTGKQSGLAALSGVLTGAFGVLGGRIAQKLDIADIDSFLLKEIKSGKKPDLNFAQAAYQKVVNIIKGAISEGTLEELPQSLQEQALQNEALGRDWREGLAEAAASGWFLGSAMGGGVNVLTPLRQDTDDIDSPPNTAQVIKEAENLAVNTSTGDPALDKSLDEIVREGENIVLAEAAKLEEIDGGKLEEELSLTKQKLKDAEEEREKEKFRKEMLELVREFDATATVPRNLDPISQSLANQEMEAELADVETTIDPKTGKLVMVPKPKVEPVVEQKQIKTKEEKIAAYEALKKEYDDRLYILTENQSEEEAKATDPKLKLLSDALDQLGLPKIYGKDLKKGSQDVVGAIRKKLGLTPAAKRIAKAKAEKVVKAPKLVEPKPVKAPKVDLEKIAQKEAEDREDLRVKLVNMVENAKNRKKGAALSRLDELVTKAESAGFTELAKDIEKDRTKLANQIAENAKERADVKAINAKKKAKVLPKAERIALNKKINEEKQIKKEEKIAKTLITIPKGALYEEETTKGISAVKSDYASKIVAAERSGNGILFKELRKEFKDTLIKYREGKYKRKLTPDELEKVTNDIEKEIKSDNAQEKGFKLNKRAQEAKANTGRELANKIKFNVKPTQDVTEFLLDEIINGKDKAFAALASILKNTFNAHKTVTTFIGNPKYDKIRRNKAGVFTDEFGFQLIQLSPNYIQNKPGETARLFLHELVHGITSTKIHQLEDFVKGRITQEELGLTKDEISALNKLNDLFEKAKAETKSLKKTKNQEYGFKNLSEFVTQSLTDVEFQKLMSTIPSSERGMSVFDKLLDIIAEFFGLTKDRNILADIFKATEELAINTPESQLQLEKAKTDLQNETYTGEKPESAPKTLKEELKIQKEHEDLAAAAESAEKEKFDTEKALEDYKRTLEGEFGLDEGAIEDINFVDAAQEAKDSVIKYLIKHGISFYKRKEISQDEYIGLAPRKDQPVLRGLHKIINKYKNKQKDVTRYFTLEVPDGEVATYKGPGGFYAPFSKNDSAYIVVLVDSKGNPIGHRNNRNVVLHEAMHDYTKLMFLRAYTLDVGFRNKMEYTFKQIRGRILLRTKDALRTLENEDKELTPEHIELLNAISRYVLPSGKMKELAEFLQSRLYTGAEKISETELEKIVSNIYSTKNLYAFKNVDEFLSEVFSDSKTVAFLSSIVYDKNIKTGIYKGEKRSALYKWFEDLLDYVKEKFSFTPVENNVLEYTMDVIANYDVEFSEAELERLEIAETYDLLSIKAIDSGEEAPTKTEVKKALNSPIVKKLTETIWKRPEIKTFNDTLEYIKRVNQRLPEKAKLGDVYAQAIFAQVQKRRKHLEIRTKHKELLDSYVAKNEKSPKFTKKRMQDLKDFAAVNIKDLKYNEIDTYINGYTDLAYNAILDKKAYTIMIKYGKANVLLKEALDIAPKLKKTGLKGLLASASNPATFSTIIGKFQSEVSDKVLRIFYGGIMGATARSTSESHDLFTSLSELATKEDLRHNNLVKVGMYGGIFSTKANPADQINWEQEVVENAELNYQAAVNKLNSKQRDTYRGKLKESEIKDEVKIAKELLDSIKKNRSMNGLLSKGEQKVYDAIRQFAELHQEDFARNAKGMWDSDAPLLYNYFPKQAQGKVDGTIDSKNPYAEDELIRGNADNLYAALDSGENTTDNKYAEIYSKKVFSNYARTDPKNYYYEYDALSISKKWSKALLYDIYASAELKALNRLMANKTLQAELGNDLYGGLLAQLKSIISVGKYTDMSTTDYVGKGWRRFMKGRDNLYMATLATSGQVILQASSGFVAAAVIASTFNPKKSGWKNFKMALKYAGQSTALKNSPLNKFLKETGLGIQLRDIGFENFLTPDDYRKFIGKSRLRATSENITEWGIRSGDKFAARAVWFAAFFDAGGTIENPTKEAVVHAERQVGLMQNMSDINFAAPMFKPTGSVSRKILMGMFFAYKSFALNAWLSMVKSAPRLISSREARQVMAAQLGSLFAYHTLSIWAVKWLYNSIAKAFAEGDDDDDDENKETYTLFENVRANVAWDATIGMASPALIDQGLRFLFNEKIAPHIYANDMEEFDKFTDSPIYGPARYNDVYKSMVGPGFRGYADVAEDLMTALTIEKSDQDAMAVFEDESKKEEAKQNLFMTAIATTIGMWTMVPLRGDIMRVLRAQKQIEKKRARNAASKYGSGTINDSELESRFEFSDYDQDFNEEDGESFEEFIIEDN